MRERCLPTAARYARLPMLEQWLGRAPCPARFRASEARTVPSPLGRDCLHLHDTDVPRSSHSMSRCCCSTNCCCLNGCCFLSGWSWTRRRRRPGFALAAACPAGSSSALGSSSAPGFSSAPPSSSVPKLRKSGLCAVCALADHRWTQCVDRLPGLEGKYRPRV